MSAAAKRKPQVLFLLGLTLLSASAGAQDDLARFHDKDRLLLIVAPSMSDPHWRRQNSLLAGSAAQFRERELLRFDILERGMSRGPEESLSPSAAARLQVRYRVKSTHFRVLLRDCIKGIAAAPPPQFWGAGIGVEPEDCACRSRPWLPRIGAGGLSTQFLIGKDGHIVCGEPLPVPMQDLTARIDRMPMRRAEMRRRHEIEMTP